MQIPPNSVVLRFSPQTQNFFHNFMPFVNLYYGCDMNSGDKIISTCFLGDFLANSCLYFIGYVWLYWKSPFPQPLTTTTILFFNKKFESSFLMRIFDTINGNIDALPIWFMRQAGRYLPEYKALRATTSDFINYCLDSNKAAEATLQPLRRYDLDAAIVFSDILLIPWAMGCDLRFEEGKGPILTPLKNPAEFPITPPEEVKRRLAPIGKTIQKTRTQLAKNKALIGFCGAPWTVSTYIIEGGTSRDFSNARKWLWQDSAAYNTLIDTLITHSIEFLVTQAKSGADILMIFDSWAGIVPGYLQKSYIFEPVARIIDGVRARGITVPIIAFPKGLSGNFTDYVHTTTCDVLAIDHSICPEWLNAHLPTDIAVQGNLDPMAVEIGGKTMLKSALDICNAFKTRPHIFNLGHGMGQFTPPQHVAELVNFLRTHASLKGTT